MTDSVATADGEEVSADFGSHSSSSQNALRFFCFSAARLRRIEVNLVRSEVMNELGGVVMGVLGECVAEALVDLELAFTFLSWSKRASGLQRQQGMPGRLQCREDYVAQWWLGQAAEAVAVVWQVCDQHLAGVTSPPYRPTAPKSSSASRRPSLCSKHAASPTAQSSPRGTRCAAAPAPPPGHRPRATRCRSRTRPAAWWPCDVLQRSRACRETEDARRQ